MNIGIYNPYLDTLGGGERYTFAIASFLSKSHSVSIFWDDLGVCEAPSKRFHMDLTRIAVTRNIWKSTNSIHKIICSRQYDVIFFVSDGSIPLSLSKKTYLIFQFPVNWVHVSPWTQVKLGRVSGVICYSGYV